jgi:phage tail-like protein
MPIIGQPRSYRKEYAFAVEIDGLEIAWFTKVSGLKRTVSVAEQHEAGVARVANKSPSKVKYENVSLEVGATDNRELWDWNELVHRAAADSGTADDAYKKNLAVVERDRAGNELGRWNVFNAFPIEFDAGNFDAASEANRVHTVVLAIDYFEYQAA